MQFQRSLHPQPTARGGAEFQSWMEKSRLDPPDYDVIDVTAPWEKGVQPLASCLSVGQKGVSHSNVADANLQKAVSKYCGAGLGAMVEFYVDPRFQANYERLKGPDGWIEKAFVTHMGLHGKKDNVSAEEDLLVQSVHHFSKFPIVLTNFGSRVPKHMTPDRFPSLVIMHARTSATSLNKSWHLNRLTTLMFTKVKGGAALDADQFVNREVDIMIERAFEETTQEYPYPILPVHWMSRDPESSDMMTYPAWYAFEFESEQGPPRSMRWGHGHPTWTFYSLPWLAKWTSYELAPETTEAPDWLMQEGNVNDEDLLNFASWADGLTKQWCKFDIPQLSSWDAYLMQADVASENQGVDSKYFPNGIPLWFVTSHSTKIPSESYGVLSQLWGKDNQCKAIYYDGKWFDSGRALQEYDPSLRCIA